MAISVTKPIARWEGGCATGTPLVAGASFSAVNGNLLVMCVGVNETANYISAIAGGDSFGFTWTLQKKFGFVDDGNLNYAAILTAPVTSNQTITPQFTLTHSQGGSLVGSAVIYQVSGQHASSPIGANGSGWNLNQTQNLSGYTSTGASSQGFVSWTDDNDRTGISSSDSTIDTTTASGVIGIGAGFLSSTSGSSGSSITFNYSNSVGGVKQHYVALEILPAAGGSNTNASPGDGTVVVSGIAPLVNPQAGHPGSDASAGSWTPSTGGSLFGCIDEAARGDSDYIQSGANPSGDACIVKLASMTDPGVDAGFHLQWAAGAIGTTGTIVGSLRQGNSPGTEIAAWTHSNLPVGSFQEFDDVITSAQAANITDFTDLYLKFVAS